ncbi:MAG: hypothetical protein AAF541_22810 [Pseudomonadota bacterium]
MDNKLFVAIILLSIFGGCSKGVPSQAVNMDLNSDGKDDVFYESAEDGSTGYYELSDRNFDGSVDQTVFFDSQNKPIFARLDNNFDERLDSVVTYENYNITRVLIDTNANWIFDSEIKYDQGVMASSTHFESHTNKLTEYKYKFGLPYLSRNMEIEKTEQEFHESLNSKIQLNR